MREETSTCATAHVGSHAAFRSDLRVYAPQPDDADRRYTVYDPVTDLSYYLGANELCVARLFNGARSAADVCAILAGDGRRLPVGKLVAFEQRLHRLGLLVRASESGVNRRDPAAGIDYGPLKRALSIQVMRFAPERLLDAVFARAQWLCSRGFVAIGCIAIAVTGMLPIRHASRFAVNVVDVYSHDWHWVFWHYPVVVASIAVHELGHALACRLYRVRVTDFGIAVYLLLATGWARPLQRDWSALPLRDRLVTIAMGPFASLLFVAAGLAMWAAVPRESPWNTLAIVMSVSAAAALVPTLLPFFNGDTYLALTEWFGVPRLRQRAFRYVRDRLLRREPDDAPVPERRRLYWATAFGTAAGWIAAWAWVASGIVRLMRAG
ncbi:MULTISPECIES: M50 family metallopeptidase [Burkholderia]|uniref:M50 family metallopeptidase n=1 Tax=Burkholderia sola TaxID=2843302 RepID=A0ABV2C916_9BURK|nr:MULTISPECIES: M50 family metallopeptidase [unclassified Burkholderia]MBP0607663.1 M50 family metallopeptidase [Burkholderia sp. CpTa8-5]MBP0717633.1 M50 family metallopeptidase [Burkholderia sp. AcTa6-5]